MHERTARRHARAAGAPPKKRGRPPVEGARENLPVRISPELRARVDEAAAAAGLTLTAFVEAALLAAIPQPSGK